MSLRESKKDLFESTRMSFGEHLEELRKVLFKCLISIAIGCVFGFMFANQVIKLLNGPLERAMTRYAQLNAVDELEKRNGYVDPELLPWLQRENLIPQQQMIDPMELVSALRTVIPEFAQQIKIEPYSFQPKNFKSDRLQEFCLRLADPMSEPDPKIAERLKAIAGMLSDDERDQIKLISTSTPNAISSGEQTSEENAGDTSFEFVSGMMNRLSKAGKLFEQPAFAELVQEPERKWYSFLSPPTPNLLAKMKSRYEEKQDPAIGIRLNRALLASLFQGQMSPLEMELVPVEVWERGNFQPQSLGVSESFMVWFKSGLITGFTFAAPFVFYHLWTFVAAGLYPHEQKYVHMYLPISLALFAAGVLLAFIFVFDPVLEFLFSFNRQMGISPQIRIKEWLGFVMLMPLGFGTAFQLPLVMLFVNRIGLISLEDFVSKWRVAIMIIFIVSMFLTPQDPISLLLMAVPLSFLYFVGLAMIKWMPQSRNPFGESEIEPPPI